MDDADGTPQQYLNAQTELARAIADLLRASRFARYHPTCDLLIVTRWREGNLLPKIDIEPRTSVALTR